MSVWVCACVCVCVKSNERQKNEKNPYTPKYIWTNKHGH